MLNTECSIRGQNAGPRRVNPVPVSNLLPEEAKTLPKNVQAGHLIQRVFPVLCLALLWVQKKYL